MTMDGAYVGELCHIEAASPDGPRYNPKQTDEERRSPANLIFMCHEHHVITHDAEQFTVKKLRELKAKHEALPAVVFNHDLLSQRVGEVLAKEEELLAIVKKQFSDSLPPQNWPICGPVIQDAWTPDQGRFYTFTFLDGGSYKFMMKDGILYVDQKLPSGLEIYYEIDSKGGVREARLPFPVAEYHLEIPPHLILREESTASKVGDSAHRTLLKWSRGEVVQHFLGGTLIGLDLHTRVVVSHEDRTIKVLDFPSSEAGGL